MSKKISLIILALTLVLVMVIPSNGVFAANKKVKTVSAVQENGKITVSGEVESGMLAVAIQVLDEEGKLVTLNTGAVDSDNKYKVEINAVEGKYTIKVADYDGGETVTKTIPEEKDENNTTDNEETENTTTEETTENNTEVTKTEEKTESNTPKTGDNIVIFVSLFAIALVGLTYIKLMNRKKCKRNRK